jgi:hypothetical protein
MARMTPGTIPTTFWSAVMLFFLKLRAWSFFFSFLFFLDLRPYTTIRIILHPEYESHEAWLDYCRPYACQHVNITDVPGVDESSGLK